MVRPPRRQLRVGRDLVTYTVAIGGIIYEVFTVISQHRSADGVLLAFLGGLLGLPTFLKRDQREAGKQADEPPDPEGSNGRHRS